jgi:hypothetical protein
MSIFGELQKMQTEQEVKDKVINLYAFKNWLAAVCRLGL